MFHSNSKKGLISYWITIIVFIWIVSSNLYCQNTISSHLSFSGEQGKEGWFFGYLEEEDSLILYDVYDELKATWWNTQFNNFKYGFVSKFGMHPGSLYPAVRQFVAPKSGNLTIFPSELEIKKSADGIAVQIRINDKRLWPKSEEFYIMEEPILKIPELSHPVKKGEKIFFIIGSNLNAFSDFTKWKVALKIN